MSPSSSTQQQSSTLSTLQTSQYPFLKVINPEDFKKWRQSKEKIIIAPTLFLTGFAAFILVTKKIQLGRFLSNPLKNSQALEKSQNRWNFFLKHTLVFGTFAVAVGAYFKKEFNKYSIFKEYEKQVNFYMRWRVENQIIGFINEEKQLSSQQKIKQVGKVL